MAQLMRKAGASRLRGGWAALCFVSLAALLLAACGQPNTPAPTLEASPQPTSRAAAQFTIRLGAVLSLSGAATQVGQSQQRGIQLAVEEVNASQLLGPATQIQVMIEDDASDRGQATNVVQKLITQNKVLAIVGPSVSSTAFAADPVAQQMGVPVVAISSGQGPSQIGDFIFQVGLTDTVVIPSAIKALRRDNQGPFSRVALLVGSDDPVTRASGDVFKRSMLTREGGLATEQGFPRHEVDFTSQIEAIREVNPDLLCVAAYADDAARFVRQARSMGLTTQIVGSGSLGTQTFLQRAGDAAEGVVVASAWSPHLQFQRSQDFVQRFRARFGTDPDQAAAHAYTGVQVIAEGVRRAPPGPGVNKRRALRDSLLQIRNFDTPLGPFSFDPSGDGVHPPVVLMVRNGAFALYR